MPYWDERVVEKAKQFPDVKVEKYHVSFMIITDLAVTVQFQIDILCAHFVARPQM